MRSIIFSIAVLSSLSIFSQGYYLEFKVSGSGGVVGNMKVYSQNGASRTDIEFTNKQAKQFMPNGMCVLVFEKEPNKVYLLNSSNKTYSELTSNSDDWKDYDQKEYEVTLIGNEKVNNFNATHVKLQVKNTSFKQDLWLSKDVAGYNDFNNIKTKYTGKVNLYKALSEKGAEGFPVRIAVKENGADMQIDLVKAEKKGLPESLFSLTGYQKGSMVPGLPAELDIDKLQNFQNLSPEEQKKLMEEMLKSIDQNLKEKK